MRGDKLSPLERYQQAQKEKEMWFKKADKPKKKEKKTRVEEFEFKSGGYKEFEGLWDYPGKVSKYSPLREIEEGWTKAMIGHNGQLNDAKIRFGIEILSKQYRTEIRMENTPGGDYLTFRTRDRIYRVSRTFIASTTTDLLLENIESGLGLKKMPGQLVGERITGKPKSATDDWAEKWARENS
jgi:hypothetical protein